MTKQLITMPRYEAYKDSGVEWLGDIPQGWKTKRLKYLGYMYAGLAGKKGDDFSKEPKSNFSRFIPFTSISTTSVVKQLYQYVLVKQHEEQNNVFFNDILFLMSSETLDDIGKCSIYKENEENLYLNSFCKGFRTTSKFALPVYINYLLQSSYYRNYFGTVARGFTRINLKQEYVKGALIPLPSSEEQIAIANFLDQKTTQIDQAITIKEKQITLLKERKQILIQNAVIRGLNPDAPMRDSGVEWIGEIPAHWDIKRLRFLGNTQNGISAGADYFGSGYPFVSYGDVYNNRELPITVNGLAQSSDVDREQYSIKKGDVLFTRTSETIEEIGFASTCLSTIENATFAGFLIRFRPKTKQLFDGFSKFYFNAPMLRQYFVKEMNLVIRASLTQELLKNLLVLLPPLGEQKTIYDYIENETAKIGKAISLHQQQIEKLKEYKTTLINSAVTGKIKVA